MVSEICKKLDGNFCIISYGNYVFVDAENTRTGITSFSGTDIRIRISPNKMRNAQKIISEIVVKGESEAKVRRNAFKYASKRSSGLYY